MEPYLIGAVVVIAVAQAATLWFVRRQQQAFDQVENRVAHLTAAISLLTDTTEGALRDLLQRAEQANARPVKPPRPNAVTARRVNGAARRGRSVQDIAATERLSEGEVRLRLQLSQPPAAEHATGKISDQVNDKVSGKVNGKVNGKINGKATANATAKAKEKDHHAAVC